MQRENDGKKMATMRGINRTIKKGMVAFAIAPTLRPEIAETVKSERPKGGVMSPIMIESVKTTPK